MNYKKYKTTLLISCIFLPLNIMSQDYTAGGYQGGLPGSGGNKCLIHEIMLDDTGGIINGYGEGFYPGPPQPDYFGWYGEDTSYTIWIHNPGYDTGSHFRANLVFELIVSDSTDYSVKYNVVYSLPGYSTLNDTTATPPLSLYRSPPLDDIILIYQPADAYRVYINYIDLQSLNKGNGIDSVYSFCLTVADHQPEWIGVEITGHNIEIPNASLCINNLNGPEPEIGRCCYNDKGLVYCDDLYLCDCERMQGTWYPGLSCSSDPCFDQAGACCLNDGSCFLSDSTDCENAGGSWQGPYSSCDTNICPLPGNTISGFAYYDNILNSPLGGSKIYLYTDDGQLVDSTITELDGSFAFDSVAEGDYILGATTAQARPTGVLNAADGLLILQHFVQINLLTGLRKVVADVNDDAVINSTDALQTVEAFIDNSIIFPLGTWMFETIAVISVDTTTTFADIRGIFVGDVNGSYNPIKEFSIDLKNVDEIINTIPGEVFDFPIRIENDFEIAALSLVLDYDQYHIKIHGVKVPGGNGQMLYKASEGRLRMAWFGLDPMLPQAGGAIAIIKMSTLSLSKEQHYPFINAGWETKISNSNGQQEYHGSLLQAAIVSDVDKLWIISYPNPFRETTTIEFNIPEDGHATLRIMDLAGKIVFLEEGDYSNGIHNTTFDAKVLKQGLYITQLILESPGKSAIKVIRMIKL